MRSYHRKTLIRKEGWVQIDDWYWCPLPVVHKRCENERIRLNNVKKLHPIHYALGAWIQQQYKLEARLAHACDDGRIRAPSWVEYFTMKNGSISIYGKCRRCDKKLSDGIKGIIIMEREL
jgi:hypothetical protein